MGFQILQGSRLRGLVAPFAIVIEFDIFEYGLPGMGQVLVNRVANLFHFQAPEKAFANGIIPAISFSTHAANDMRIQPPSATPPGETLGYPVWTK